MEDGKHHGIYVEKTEEAARRTAWYLPNVLLVTKKKKKQLV